MYFPKSTACGYVPNIWDPDTTAESMIVVEEEAVGAFAGVVRVLHGGGKASLGRIRQVARDVVGPAIAASATSVLRRDIDQTELDHAEKISWRCREAGEDSVERFGAHVV